MLSKLLSLFFVHCYLESQVIGQTSLLHGLKSYKVQVGQSSPLLDSVRVVDKLLANLARKVNVHSLSRNQRVVLLDYVNELLEFCVEFLENLLGLVLLRFKGCGERLKTLFQLHLFV